MSFDFSVNDDENMTFGRISKQKKLTNHSVMVNKLFNLVLAQNNLLSDTLRYL